MSKPILRQCLPGLLGAVLALCLVPALAEAQTAPVLDHFKCYRTTGQPPDVTVLLHDQFDPAGVPPDPTFVRWPVKFCLPVAKTTPALLRPIEFCNPVEKTHGDVTTPIKNPTAHLLCYTITQTTFQGDALVRNQFGGGPMPMATADMLCVPSQKLKFSIVVP